MWQAPHAKNTRSGSPQRCSGFFFEYPWVRTLYTGEYASVSAAALHRALGLWKFKPSHYQIPPRVDNSAVPWYKKRTAFMSTWRGSPGGGYPLFLDVPRRREPGFLRARNDWSLIISRKQQKQRERF